ncbi:MAG: Fe-S protein assembly co-chaperone HscB [Myxococcales bacterium]|nr:Fe-S protein assembly co-chaperone HscB [Myxococcales bacterium]
MDPFATLGLPRRFDLDRDQLERHYRELQRALHPDRHVGAPASQRRMTLLKAVEVNEAYRKLKDELSRAEALVELTQPQPPDPTGAGCDQGSGSVSTARPTSAGSPAEPGFLMQMMELREALGDAKSAQDIVRVRSLAAEVDALRVASRAALASGFEAEHVNWDDVRAHISRLKYYGRFLDEVAVFEDDHA